MGRPFTHNSTLCDSALKHALCSGVIPAAALSFPLRRKGKKGRQITAVKEVAKMRPDPFSGPSAVKNLKIPQSEIITPTIPTEEEIAYLLKKAEENDKKKKPLLGGHLTLFLLMYFGCGMRRSEALAARLENIDWEQRGLLLTKTKTNKPRMVGLAKRLYNQLLPRKGEKGFILPQYLPGSVTHAIRKHFDRCGIKMRLHDTRHTYTTLLQEKKVSPLDAMGRTGHTDMKMLSHYSHPKLDIIYEDQFEFMQDDSKKMDVL